MYIFIHYIHICIYIYIYMQYISIYSNGTGMLPQANAAPRINKLREISIKVIGESDGVFNTGDYILFFGQNPDVHFFDVQKNIFHLEMKKKT